MQAKFTGGFSTVCPVVKYFGGCSTNSTLYFVMDLDVFNLEQDIFYPQVSGVEPSTTEANNTFSPMDYDICNSITDVLDLDAAATGSSGIGMLVIEMYKNINIRNPFSLVDMH